MASKQITDLSLATARTGEELAEISQLSDTVFISAATISASAAGNSFDDSAAGFLAAGFAVGDRINVKGFTGDLANNILIGVVTEVVAGSLTIGGTDGDVIVDDAAGETVTITKWVSRRVPLSEIVPAGGTTDQALVKMSGSDYDYDWGDVASGAGGGGGGLWSKISTSRTTAAQASLAITVPAGYDHLRLVALSRAAATAAGLEVTLNNDRTASAYDFERLLAGAAADTLNTTFIQLLQATSTDRADLFASIEINLPFVSEAKDKQFHARVGKSEGEDTYFGCLWDNTAPVTSIELTPEVGSGGFVADCVFVLYGIKTSAVGAITGEAAFIGARATRTATFAVTGATETNVPFDSEAFDTNGFHDIATNNTRLTIPAGVDFVEIIGALSSITGLENDYSAWITKNGTTAYPGVVGSGVRSLNGTRKGLSLSTGPLAVTEGDYFELRTNNFSAETLTIAGTFLSVKALSGGASAHSTVLVEATIAKTLALTDIDLYVRFTNAATKTCTVDDEATTPMPVNSEVHLRNVGAGSLTIVEDAGVTVNVPSGGTLVLATGMTATLKKVATDEWDLIGQTVAA